ncbi:MAG: hypothetical protein OXC29_06785, partial [Rhodococcus sp.]|nr:hypothetical protein [Rhodococcus sp. (in: high G+C Gram-positive bacteria)]
VQRPTRATTGRRHPNDPAATERPAPVGGADTALGAPDTRILIRVGRCPPARAGTAPRPDFDETRNRSANRCRTWKVFIDWDNSNVFISAQQVAVDREDEGARFRLRSPICGSSTSLAI